ncbi:hypothetical protein CTTA_2894 [Comamonas testosteroni]|uniref:Uncharacterized protein n=1 Tax=Comamonas testosteroni TaxID=285 RepID=A0A5A7MGA0_COMTE|nr:hypothetical protein [Comamonas testosteroni]GEQ75889.1 hypothetical protein CTTA_2894 [Comamonas testosteroni]
MLASQFERALPAKLMIDLLTCACDASTGIEHASGRSIDTGVNHDPDAIGTHDANIPPKTRHYRADIREMCHAKLQADSRRPAERIRPKGEREVTVDIVLRILMQHERYSAQDSPPSYIIDRPAAD